MGMVMGFIGDRIKIKAKSIEERNQHEDENENCLCHDCHVKKTPRQRVFSVLRYAFIDMPREIGLEMLAGVALAAIVTTVGPIGAWIGSYLKQGYAYLFALLFGLTMYMCAAMSIPFVHALISQGLNPGAGLSLLIIGPIVSYGTILVLRKEFGIKTLAIFIISISALSLSTGFIFNLLNLPIKIGI